MRLSLITLIGASLHTYASPVVKLSNPRDLHKRYADWPTYDELPLDPSHPTKAAWGVWGAEDVYGALNHITQATILSAAQSEIRTGLAINLNLELDIPDPPVNPTRKPLTHLFQPEDGYTDDVLVMNTQISTQYDGLRHFPYSDDGNTSTYRFYNELDPFVPRCHWICPDHSAGYADVSAERHRGPWHPSRFRQMDGSTEQVD